MTTPTVTPPDIDRELTYKTRWLRKDGKCRLRAWTSHRVAVVTELAENPGPSVTNAAEDVAHAVEQALALQRTARSLSLYDNWTLIEHYPPHALRGHTFDVVTFASRDREQRPSGPRWSPAKLNDDIMAAITEEVERWTRERIGDEAYTDLTDNIDPGDEEVSAR